MLGEYLTEHLLGLEDLLGLDLDVRGLAGDAAPGLVQHDLGVGQGEAIAFGSGGQNHGAARLGSTDAVGRHGRADEAHGVVDGHGIVDGAAGRVDIEADLASPLEVVQIEHLHDDFGGAGVVDFADQEDDSILEQHVVETHLTVALVLPAAVLTVRIGIAGDVFSGVFHEHATFLY